MISLSFFQVSESFENYFNSTYLDKFGNCCLQSTHRAKFSISQEW